MGVPVLAKVGRGIAKLFGLAPVSDHRGGWWPFIREPFTGAWQRNCEWSVDTVLASQAVFACMTLIASDIAKLRWRLVAEDADGIWNEMESAAFSPVLRRPNNFQSHIQFKEFWIVSKLTRGNTYVLKVRDNRGVVRQLFVLDPQRVQPLITPGGEVYYQLSPDNLTGGNLPQSVTVPASEIIHDRIHCLFHPLMGVSPLFAAGLAADTGLRIQTNAQKFFANGSQPGGILIAPGRIDPANAAAVKAHWESEYTGDNAGKVAVLGDGMKYEALRMSAVDSQMIESLKWTAEVVCSVFHVPGQLVGVVAEGALAKVEDIYQRYYSQCLQIHIESMEEEMDHALGLDEKIDGRRLGVECDLDGLIRMDSATQIDTYAKAVGGSLMKPNEARKKMNLSPLKGGDTIYMQQQNYSLEALAERDQDKPFAKPTPAPAGPPALPNPDAPAPDEDDEEERAAEFLIRGLAA